MIDVSWELFTSMRGHKGANKALNNAASKAVRAGLKTVADVGSKHAGQVARSAIRTAQLEYFDFGACDSEGDIVAFEIIEKYFPDAMANRWDFG